MWNRRSAACSIQDAFSPSPCQSVQQHPLLCSPSFLKNPACVLFSVCGWALQKIFSPVVFQDDRACFTLPTNALYRGLQKKRVGKGVIYLRMGSCFTSKKKNQCFEILLWSEKAVFVLDTGKKAVVVYKPCLTRRPLSPPKSPSAMLCVSDHGHNLSSPAPVKMWTHSTVYLWDFMVLCDTDSFRNAE